MLVEVSYAPVLAYMEDVISGTRQYLLEPPLFPGRNTHALNELVRRFGERVRPVELTVRTCGRAVLMGGVGMLGGPELELPYPWIMRNNITIRGAWMYDSDVPSIRGRSPSS